MTSLFAPQSNGHDENMYQGLYGFNEFTAFFVVSPQPEVAVERLVGGSVFPNSQEKEELGFPQTLLREGSGTAGGQEPPATQVLRA